MIRDMIGKDELGDIYHLYLQCLNLGRFKRDLHVWWNSALTTSLLFCKQPAQKHQLACDRYLQANLKDLNMVVIEMTNGTSAFMYHNWLHPENTAN
jgi:hypothetical protein